MPISQSKYVEITSGIGGASAAARKDLILRLFTTNSLFPINKVLEFSSSSDVADYVGSSSNEAKIASAYFGWVSKQINTPSKISIFRYSLTATAPFLRSTIKLPSIGSIAEITDGAMTVSMGGTSYEISSLDFSTFALYSDVASTLQTAIRANTAGGTLWTAATVTYNTETGSFILTGGDTGENVIVAATAGTSGTDISSVIGWSSSTNPIISDGTNATTLADVLNNSVEISNNFASYAFVNATLSTADIDTIGAFNDEQNYQYMFCGDVTSSNYNDIVTAASAHSGMAINYQPYNDALPAYLMPATILAATDYDKVNGTVNYMYQLFPNQAVTVDTNALSKTLDNLKINYNGQTQKAGSNITFYQDGYLADGTDIAVYANEIWLKDAMATELLNLEIGLDKIPANIDGLGLIETTLQVVIAEALNNGVISVGKPLTNTQKAYITQLTGDSDAWKTVNLNGYVLSTEITQKVESGKTIYIAEYTLVYAKGDSIRKVEGKHVLI